MSETSVDAKKFEQIGLEDLGQLSFEQWLEYIEGSNRNAVERFMSSGDNRLRLTTAPGSSGAHHNWPGGYQEHLRQTFEIVTLIYHNHIIKNEVFSTLPPREHFSLSDALCVMFLHDIEKPFIYSTDPALEVIELRTKKGRVAFRDFVIEEFGFELTETMENALKYVEGVRDKDYIKGQRQMGPLAALCHTADLISARLGYNFDPFSNFRVS